jgi:hypothetical protein
VYEKEYLAILMAVDQWRHYLLHNEFVIHTDQRSLIHLKQVADPYGMAAEGFYQAYGSSLQGAVPPWC